ncbi:MAG TPA: thioesterase family protein [Anaerolineae bacterium]|nr:thioesterase family protein [Anaerolineae bacterium]
MGGNNVVETCLRVRYAETDAMGIVYHTNYIVWFEVGRGEFMRQRGGNYREFEEQGLYLPVTAVDARFLAPARYDDVVVVRTSVSEARSRSVTMYYEVLMQDTGQLLVTGHTKHLCTDRDGRVRRFPRDLVDAFSTGAQEHA